MTARLSCAIVLASLVAAPHAMAQPAAPQPQPQPAAQPAPADPSKMDAKALMQTGVRLFELKDYLGALAIFKDAYARFASAKILLNIGTTLKLLDRKAEAANTYQRYLDSADADAARKPQVGAELTELDKSLGVVELTVTPADAEVRFPGSDEWIPADHAKLWRIAPGAFTIDAHKTGYQNAAQQGSVEADQRTAVTVALVLVPTQSISTSGDSDLMQQVEPEQPRSRIGALATMRVSVVPKLGSALFIGATFDVLPQVAIDAAVMLGPGLVTDGMATLKPPAVGGYVGGNYAFLDGAFRPRAGAGLTVIASSGARLQARAAGGLEYVANRNISVTVELGAEVPINPENDIRDLAIVPSVGVAGRL